MKLPNNGATEQPLRGFRLERLEVYNWGTFHNRVWVYEPGGRNSLLTGDIGSGKSTLVDAVTTLLVPAHRVQFNRAAGAEKQERTLRSYFLGYYKSARGDSGPGTKPVQHRDNNSYSVLLAVFRNPAYQQTVTLAQVFWMKEAGGQPARFYTVSDSELRIADHFSSFGGEVPKLRKRLRQIGAELFESFPGYSAAFRRRFGLPTEQALELFHQTVSMKAVGNLTSFVREQMLEEFEVGSRIQALIAHYEDLHRAHGAVVKARAQVEALTPLVAECDKFAALAAEDSGMRQCREAMHAFFSEKKAELLKARLERIETEIGQAAERLESEKQAHHAKERECSQLRQAIADNGGERLERLAGEIQARTEERERRRKRRERYNSHIAVLDLEAPLTPEEFVEQRRQCQSMLAEQTRIQADKQNLQMDLRLQRRDLQTEFDQVEHELASLRVRRSNLPPQQVEIRSRLCRQLGLPESELPYVGELLQVKPEERQWEGAAERLLRNFALALLVPDRHYAKVNEWVERTSLGQRMVYYRIIPDSSAPDRLTARDSLVKKLAIKPDTPHFGWLDRQLRRRYDYACCANLADFRKETRAITLGGQVKSRGDHHEKDDRREINDRRWFVLGWSNQEKIQALVEQRDQLQKQGLELFQQERQLSEELEKLSHRFSALHALQEYQEFQEIDWQSLGVVIRELEQEKRALENASNILAELTQQLQLAELSLDKSREALDTLHGQLSVSRHKLEETRKLWREALEVPCGEDERAVFPQLEEMVGLAFGELKLRYDTCDAKERELREWLTSKIDAKVRQINNSREKILQAMDAFRHTYPLETQEMDSRVEAGFEYAAFLERLHRDDLPRFEERFRTLLHENTIREIANFQSQLAMERETIRERIEQINGSLRQIDYNPGRYIVLELQLTTDPEIRDFQSELRACTEGSLTGSEDEQYSETKFLRVRDIIERFRGREGQAELDRRWTRKVTDVRQWFTFSASERWKSDDTEHEHYADSGGKSGGQKEKLAYTVLAASLSYQYGLEREEERPRTFRFVVIDEAFGRSSDESTRFGLELFRTLDLQLMIVTPLQKIHTIEPYVQSVGFCHTDNETACSAIQNLSIQEYQAQKREFSR